jgi:hypothetical protein
MMQVVYDGHRASDVHRYEDLIVCVVACSGVLALAFGIYYATFRMQNGKAMDSTPLYTWLLIGDHASSMLI